MVLGIPSLGILDGFDLTTFSGGIGRIILSIIMFAFMGAITFYIFWRSKKKKQYNKKIFWFEEVAGQMIPIGEDAAAELIIPRTNVPVFYIKKKDFYLPRGTRKMGKDAFWYAIRSNGEIVNFTMTNLNEQMREAGLDFDHTDMRYAKENLLDLIKRNYRDKSSPWWKEYKDVIATVIFIFVMSLAFFFLLSKIGNLISQVGVLMDTAKQIIATATASGIQ